MAGYLFIGASDDQSKALNYTKPLFNVEGFHAPTMVQEA